MAPEEFEMDIVQNKVDLALVASSSHNLWEGLHVKEAGFGTEIYVVNEKKDRGLCVVWDRDA